MTVSLNEFGKALASLGLLAPADLKVVWEAAPQAERPKDAAALAQLLIHAGKLTELQAARVLAGQADSLVMGEYVLLAEIGAGGMGSVFRARHRRMDRIVALKVISSAAMKDEASIKRFQREVQAAARLSHPNIVTAYDAGESNKQHYLVMQYVDGGDLAALVRRDGPLSVERALHCILQAARGLEYAHAEGVVHRDIKPANLLIDKRGVVRVLDMGLARIEDASDGLTTTEQVMGTVDFMSPEQATDSSKIDHRTDIYALGCTLWFCLSGRKLYDGDSVVSRILAHREAPLPSITSIREDVPWPVEQALHKMVAKRAEDRYQSMTEVVSALEQCRSQSSSAMGSSVLNDKDFASFIQGMSSVASPGSSMTGGKRGSSSKVSGILQSGSKSATKSKTSKTPSTTDTDAVVQAEAKTKTAPPKVPRAKPLDNRFPTAQSAQEAAAEAEAEDVVEEVVAVRRLPMKWVVAGAAIATACVAGALFAFRGEDTAASVAPPPAAPVAKPAFAKAPFDAATAARLQEQWSAYLSAQSKPIPVEAENSLGTKLRLIPPGEYQMGSTPEEVAAALAKITNPNAETVERIQGEKRHAVMISTPMLFAATEVTIGQFRKFVEATKYVTIKEQEMLEKGQTWSTWQKPSTPSTDDSPVTEVCWDDAVAFCNWLSEREKLTPAYTFHLSIGWILEGSGDGYRLPTEAQWEYACRAGTTTAYSCGEDLQTLKEYAWFSGANQNKHMPVGSKKPNAFGLFDMHGSVQEWCNDSYHVNWYAISSHLDPEAPASGDRVVRGGHRSAGPVDLRSARRGKEGRLSKNGSLGFRVVRVFTIPGLYEAQ